MDPLHDTVIDVLDAMAASHGERPAVLFRDRELTYRELQRDADRLAGGLAACGLTAGGCARLRCSLRRRTHRARL